MATKYPLAQLIITLARAQQSSGLVYLPDVMRANPTVTKAVLLRAAQQDLIELRPDSGSRFSREDLQIVPKGYEGCSLLWARLK